MGRFELTGVARESPSDGAYRLVAAAGLLTLSDTTLAIVAADGTKLLHLTLSSCLYGTSADGTRLLIVPATRAAAWLLMLRTTEAATAADALRAAGCVVERAHAQSGPAPLAPISDATLSALASAPGFAELVAQMETALANSPALSSALLTKLHV